MSMTPHSVKKKKKQGETSNQQQTESWGMPAHACMHAPAKVRSGRPLAQNTLAEPWLKDTVHLTVQGLSIP
jgi:hypothetical protein